LRSENYRTKTLVFDRALPAEPGQFVMVWLPGVDEKPYSVAAADPLALTVVAVGPFSEALQSREIGDKVWIRGPLGHGYQLPTSPRGKRLLLVGGGYGVAPLHFLARRAIDAGAAVEVLIGAQTRRDLLLVEAFERSGASVLVSTEDGTAGEAGLVTELAASVIDARRPVEVFACGPVPMLEALEELCRRHRLRHQLSWEAQMRCGLGLCGECEVPSHPVGGWLACRDGPVARYEA
ncbi:MAG: dihydroorotate dehydrogenase electron transfer subunit, partial [Anaerolineae bacterium]